jgi:hypothetical protein
MRAVLAFCGGENGPPLFSSENAAVFSPKTAQELGRSQLGGQNEMKHAAPVKDPH